MNYEKRKTDGLLQQLLPVEIIAQLKAGEQPSPKYDNHKMIIEELKFLK